MKKNIWQVKLGFVLTVLFMTGGVQIPEEDEKNFLERTVSITERIKNKQ